MIGVEAMVSRRSMNERTALGRRVGEPQVAQPDAGQVQRQRDGKERHRRRHQQARLGKAPNVPHQAGTLPCGRKPA